MYSKTGVLQSGYGFLNTSFVDAGTGLTVSFLNVQDGVVSAGAYRRVKSYHFAEDAFDASDYTYYDAWFFCSNGSQGKNDKGLDQAFAWAVRDGDVAAVTVPAAAWVFGSGMIGLLGLARRRK